YTFPHCTHFSIHSHSFPTFSAMANGSFFDPFWNNTSNETTVLPTTVSHPTSARLPTSTIPSEPYASGASVSSPVTQYMDKSEVLARAIEDGATDRHIFYITLGLCMLQLLVVLAIRFVRSCACKSTEDESATSLLKDESVKGAKDESKNVLTMRTVRETRE
ncbi:hypothetical protein PENTCL1PPCAC_27132, partial [Pristionchus entomophagus]